MQTIAPFYADVDTRGTGSLFFRVTEDREVLQRADDIVHRAFLDEDGFASRSAFVATWDRVGYFDTMTDKVRVMLALTQGGMAKLHLIWPTYDEV